MEATEPRYSKAITQSFLLHIALILFFSVKAFLLPTEKFVLQDAIQVDLIALPDKATLKTPEPKATTPTTPEPAPEPTPKPAPKSKETPTVTPQEKPHPRPKVDLNSKRKLEKRQALARLKALQSIEEDVEHEERSQRTIKLDQPKKGNVLSSGTKLSGINQIQHRNYITDLDRHVKNHWVLPQWLANANLKATVRVFIDERGYVTRKEMMTSSGNNVYDQMAMTAIMKASPFPVPPSKFINIVATQGVDFGFPE